MSIVFDVNSIINVNNEVSDFIAPDVSFTREAYDFSIGTKREYNTSVRKLYDSILESNGNTVVVNEAFSDFFVSVKKIIEKIIKFIKSLFDRFITLLMRMVKSEKYIIKHAKDFNDFDDEKNKFDYNGYVFSFSDVVPMPHAAEMEFKEDFFLYEKPSENIHSVSKKFSDKLENNYYDWFRGLVLDREGEYISSDEFANELFAEFRNNDSDTIDIQINRNYLTDAVLWFSRFKDIEKQLVKERKDIIGRYDNMQRFVEKMVTLKSKSADNPVSVLIRGEDNSEYTSQMTSNDYDLLNKFVKGKIDQLTEMSSIHNIALGAKLDAYKEKYRQDKLILYKALSKIQGNI